ncbi:hypothetical protein A2803_05435 [Candidatus Woesebacteria bacterium RIFCSPHIGHO2_01_FULL_44_21]|uniref:Beta-ketoacyl-ACP reductase n=1 Tax=Candidatus Woesebacteria bacterium RIFCSPHIGHO2_01_FULL_44_21 TaxID=1802503 RepID=A0A1F7YVV5_9BACT|nr:MAG: hypothetical protein A2803_05435 [Candidatus Woesebacteria bacterium RIFCSPHIGHO2_01_FULL_44_21]
MKLKDKVALVTGGSSGIGRATAMLFSANNVKVAISYKENEAGANEVISKISDSGGDAVSIQANLIRDSEARKLVEAVVGHFGKIDILVNNAGRYINGDRWDGKAEIWEESIKQNLLSALSVSKYTIEEMKKQKSGVIVNIASRHGLYGQLDAISYAAAKAGIINITQAQAKLMAPWGRANSVSPGTVRAGYWLTAPAEELKENISVTPLGKMIEPEDVAEAVLFLASDKARMITGQNLIVDGGYTLK